MRIRPYQAALGLVALCLGIWGGLEWRRQRADASPAGMLRRFPERDPLQIVFDVRALRRAGLFDILASSRAAEELDYQKFVADTGFDYREDLDAVYASLEGDRYLFLLRGRFDWGQIRRYAEARGVTCLNGYCSGRPQPSPRFISFFMAMPNVLAVAVGPDSSLAYEMMSTRNVGLPEPLPAGPIWLRFQPALAAPDALPPGTRAFVSAVKEAEHVTLALGPAGLQLEAELRASCRTADEARAMKQRLEETTGLLRKFLARAKQEPNPRDLSGILASGAFEQQDRLVVGRWPVPWEFVTAAAQGTL